MRNISFVTNCSVNTRDHVELLLRSLRDNLDSKEHEIIVFIDSDNEGIYEYLKSIKDQYHDLKIIKNNMKPCTGYALNNNILVELAKHDIVSYLQSDMVIGPNYDTNILSELEENSILSATRIEPPLHGYSTYTFTRDFGTDPKKFSMEKWNEYSQSVKSNRAAEYFFAPITFYKSVWQKLGGYDTRFRRSREDSDFVQRCVHAGVKLIQTWQANVYHFTCTSSRGKDWFDKANEAAQARVQLQNKADGVELDRFIRKWGYFNHGESKLYKYDVDLFVKVNRPLPYYDFIYMIEPYVSKVWLSKYIDLDQMKVSDNHSYANELFGFSNEQWSFASKFYNTDDELIRSKYIRMSDDLEYPVNSNVILELDLSKANYIDGEYIQNLHKIIEMYEVGSWQMGENMTLTINNKVKLENDISVTNPQFDMSLLTIE